MKIYRKDFKQIVKADLDSVWHFFSRPENLNEITPDDMHFEVLTPLAGIKMYPGMIVNYKIRPLLNIPMRWTTEITQVKDREYFIDEQRFGPYSFWHHQHHFKAVEAGVEMTDILHYAIPLGPIGRIMNSILVEKKINGIFSYREKIVDQLF